jgi:cell division protein FtsI/penicillin-binding protein 2
VIFCHMAQRMQVRRLVWLGLMLCAGFAALGYRLVDLQVLRHAELSTKAQQNTQREFLLEPRRGDITDIKGNLLASSVFVKTVCADPSLIGNHQSEIAHALSPLLQIDEPRLRQLLTMRVYQNKNGETVTNRFEPLKQKVSLETWDKIQAAMTNLSFGAEERLATKAERTFYQQLLEKAIFARDDQLRSYPNQSLAAHVLGYATTEEKSVDDVEVAQIVGREGVEHTLDSKLAGVRGWRLTETDGKKRELVTLREQDVEPCDGLNVVLTIDSVIQHIVEAALADAMEKHCPVSISGVVVRPRTGMILAMANLPNFDPNNLSATTPDARRNRVITDIAEPGSTFKIVVVSGALNDGIVQLNDLFDCEHGHFYYGSRWLHDHESYGTLSVQDIIMKSSNIGAAKVGIKMGEGRLYKYICDFGFGEATGLPLPGEVSAKRFVPAVTKWSKVSIAQIPMGQGISVTRLQMLMAMCAIANKGCLMRPMLVDRLEDSQHNVVAKYYPQRVRQVISENTAKLMVQALKTVVSPEGTAPKAFLEQYSVAGKTGTAQKVEDGAYVRKYFSSFIGFLPADNPELCISVTMDDPKRGYYGGQTAAPVFKQIAERAANYLNIRPDISDPAGLPDPIAAPNDKGSIKTAARSP